MDSNLPLGGPHIGPQKKSVLRILIVEDDADTADSMAILLRLYAYDVEVARDGSTALRAILEEKPDVVLLDLGLPKLDGWQLAKEIRGQITGKRPLLVAISGYARQADQQRSQEAGIDLHLVKPVDPDALDHVLQRFEMILAPGAENCPAT